MSRGRERTRTGRTGAAQAAALRPTTNKVLEALFSILAAEVPDAVFLDLYSGTGAVGLEAMSRGSRMVYLVDADRSRTRRIEALIEGCGCRDRAKVAASKAEAFLVRASSQGIVFDVVFIDPPYESDELARVLPILGRGDALSDDAAVAAEHSRRTALEDAYGVLRKVKTYSYGDTSLTLYRKEPPDGQ